MELGNVVGGCGRDLGRWLHLVVVVVMWSMADIVKDVDRKGIAVVVDMKYVVFVGGNRGGGGNKSGGSTDNQNKTGVLVAL